MRFSPRTPIAGPAANELALQMADSEESKSETMESGRDIGQVRQRVRDLKDKVEDLSRAFDRAERELDETSRTED